MIPPPAPKVSLGLPVFNGERFLQAAIDSLLGQTFTDFELLVSDNASTDRTEDICRGYAQKDPRIKYERLPENIGAARNFNRTFDRSRGEYFKWAAHDDLCHPEYLAECVAVLEHDPSIVLCHTDVEWIDEDGRHQSDYDPNLTRIDDPRPEERFRDLIMSNHWCMDAFALIRRSELAKTPLIGSYINSDRVLLAELGLRGRFHRVPRVLFLSRDHKSRSIRAMTIRERAAWFDPARGGRVVYPFWRTMAEYHRAVMRVPLSASSRMRCLASLAWWPIRNRRKLWGDVMNAVRIQGRTPKPALPAVAHARRPH